MKRKRLIDDNNVMETKRYLQSISSPAGIQKRKERKKKRTSISSSVHNHNMIKSYKMF